MQKCNSSSASIPVLYYLQNTKFIPNFHVYFSKAVKVPRPLYLSVSRIICTDIKLTGQSNICPKYDLTSVQQSYCLSPFLKENFNIIDNRYFKLLSGKNAHYITELLKKEELKELISRSPFTFDVTLNSTCNDYFRHCSSSGLNNINKGVTCCVKSPDYFDDLVLFSTSKEEETSSKLPSEQQLLNVIDRLTYSLLNFFEKPLDFKIYHKDINFKNNIKGIETKGLTAYIQTMYILRFYGFIHYAKVKVEILKITHHTDVGAVKVRWRVNGFTRQQLLVNLWKHKRFSVPAQEETEWIDGLSTFRVDSHGLIFEHMCDKMTPDNNDDMLKKTDIKTKLLRLLNLPRQRPISLNALASCYKSQDFPNYKRIT